MTAVMPSISGASLAERKIAGGTVGAANYGYGRRLREGEVYAKTEGVHRQGAP